VEQAIPAALANRVAEAMSVVRAARVMGPTGVMGRRVGWMIVVGGLM
jgi:hypothetical protein